MFNKTVDKAVGSGTRAKLARAAADNYIWMPVTTCLLFAALKLAQGQPEEIVSSCQVSFQPHCQCAATCCTIHSVPLLLGVCWKLVCCLIYSNAMQAINMSLDLQLQQCHASYKHHPVMMIHSPYQGKVAPCTCWDRDIINSRATLATVRIQLIAKAANTHVGL